MKKIVLVAHCILNKMSKVISDDPELVIENENTKKLIHILTTNDIQIIQLPCPEFIMYGHNRWGHVKEQFSTPFFIQQCQKLLEPIIWQLQEYQNNNIEIIGVIGIDKSPSCGIHKTCSSIFYGGEITTDNKKCDIINEPGIFIEVFKKLVKEKLLNDISFYDLQEFINKYN